MIFQYGSEPVLIQRILIGFEAILELNILFLGKAQKPRLKFLSNAYKNNEF